MKSTKMIYFRKKISQKSEFFRNNLYICHVVRVHTRIKRINIMILCEIDILMYTLSNVTSFRGGLSLLYVRFIPYVSSGINMKGCR